MIRGIGERHKQATTEEKIVENKGKKKMIGGDEMKREE